MLPVLTVCQRTDAQRAKAQHVTDQRGWEIVAITALGVDVDADDLGRTGQTDPIDSAHARCGFVNTFQFDRSELARK